MTYILYASMFPMMSLSILAESFSVGTLIVELLIFALLVALIFMFKHRFMKIICACGAEVCLWLTSKMAFGSDALISQILTWITALVAIIVVITVVNRIDWSNLRGKRQ
ncbi:MAG: hypothetical protein E7661_02510 [Ruminococcaceae bacterium]|nr:hypothetical protein [Oscillospiraceae bacterium]